MGVVDSIVRSFASAYTARCSSQREELSEGHCVDGWICWCNAGLEKGYRYRLGLDMVNVGYGYVRKMRNDIW